MELLGGPITGAFRDGTAVLPVEVLTGVEEPWRRAVRVLERHISGEQSSLTRNF
jgi:hypothetical protein